MNSPSYDGEQSANSWNRSSSNEASPIDSNDPNYSTSTNTYSSTKKIELKQGQQQADSIVTKTKRMIKQNWDHTCHSLCQAQKKVSAMVPKQYSNLIYWQNPIVSGIAFGVSLSIIITFIFLSSLAAISFWVLALLAVIGLYRLYSYVMSTFFGRVENNLCDSLFPADISISEQRAQEIAKQLRVNGTSFLRHTRSILLWENITNSTLFGLIVFAFFYIGLSMNALTFVLIGLIFSFTVPKIYQVYQVPIDRTAKQILDQLNQVLAKVTSGSQNKAKKT